MFGKEMHERHEKIFGKHQLIGMYIIDIGWIIWGLQHGFTLKTIAIMFCGQMLSLIAWGIVWYILFKE